MNIHYKVIWNEALGAFTAVSELARSHNKKVSSNTNRTTHRIDARLPCCGLKILVTTLMITGLSGQTWAASAYCVTDADKIAGLGQNSTGTNAVACGQGAQATGDWSIAIGSSAKASGSQTISIGQNAGSGNTGANNVFIGDTSGANNLKGKSNTFVGGMNTGSETSGSWSAAFGMNSLHSTKGDFNTGLGSYAGQRGNGDSNTSVGSWSGILVTGNNNTALGFFAGTAGSKDISNGSFVGNNNLSLGYAANYVPVGVTVKRNNTVALGAFSSVTQDGGVALGAGSVASTEKNIKGYDPATGLPRVWTTAEATAIKVAEDNLTAAQNNLAAQDSGTPGYDAAVSALYAAQTQLSQLIKTWQSTAAAVSVGDNADGTTRQITNLAAGSADTDAVNVAQLKAANTHYFSVKSDDTGTDSNYLNNGATGTNSMAAGVATATNMNTTTVVGNSSSAQNTGSIPFGSNTILGTGNTLTNASKIAILGNANTVTGNVTVNNANKSTVIGSGNQINAAAKDKINYFKSTTVIGTDNTNINNTESSLILGNANNVNGLGTELVLFKQHSKLTDSLAIGNNNTLTDTRAVGVIGGGNNASDSYSSSVIGINNTLKNASASSITGISNIISLDEPPKTFLGLPTNDVQDNIIGVSNTITGSSKKNSIIGSNNTLSGDSKQNFIAGFGNTLGENLMGNQVLASGGEVAEGVNDGILIGRSGKLEGNNTIAIGKGAKALAESAISIGTGNVVHATRSGAIGDPTTIVANATDSYSIGNNNTVNTADTFVLGNAVTTNVANSVYLGKGAEAASVLTAQSAGMSVYNSSIINGITYNYAGGTPVGVVSVGAVGAERRIQNVAAGLIAKDSTDAINGSQLYAVLQNAGWNLHTNGSTGTGSGGGTGGTPPAAGASTPNVALGDTVNITDGKNTTVSKITTTPADGSKPATHTYHIDVTGMPISYTDQNGNPIYQKADGTFADKDGKTVTPTEVNTQLVGTTSTATPKLGNVADGTIAKDSKDAVNGGQLYTVQQAAQQAKTTVSAGDNIVVTSTKNPDGSSNYAVATTKDLSVNSVKAGNTTVDNSGLSIKDGPKITQKNVDMGNQQIHGVAAGTADNDAVNVGQMNKALANVGGNLNELNNRITQVGKDADAGSASAMAVAGLPQAYLPGKSMMAISGSTYNGQTGFAIGVSTITDGGAWVFKGTATGNSQGRYGATVGAGYQW